MKDNFFSSMSFDKIRVLLNKHDKLVIAFLTLFAIPFALLYPLTGASKFSDINENLQKETCRQSQYAFILGESPTPDPVPRTGAIFLIETIQRSAGRFGFKLDQNKQVSLDDKDKAMVKVTLNGHYEPFLLLVNAMENHGILISELTIQLIDEDSGFGLSRFVFSAKQGKFAPHYLSEESFSRIEENLATHLKDLHNFSHSDDWFKSFITSTLDDEETTKLCWEDIDTWAKTKSIPLLTPNLPNKFVSILKEVGASAKRNSENSLKLCDAKYLAETQFCPVTAETKPNNGEMCIHNPFQRYLTHEKTVYGQIPEKYVLQEIVQRGEDSYVIVNGKKYGVGQPFPGDEKNAKKSSGETEHLRVSRIEDRYVLFSRPDAAYEYRLTMSF